MSNYSSVGDMGFIIEHEHAEPTRAEIMEGINRRYQILIGMDDGEFFEAIGIDDTIDEEEANEKDSL